MQPVTTVPCVELFVGLGSASHYLRKWFHPVAAFDADPAARAVVSQHFPECPMATDFQSMMMAGSGTGTFLGAAKGARVGFASPPCSQTPVVNNNRDESSYTTRLAVYMLQVLAVAPLEVLLVFESNPAIASAPKVGA
jgi:site-specific DNA-cytosine methylase